MHSSSHLDPETQCFQYDHLRRLTEAWAQAGAGDCAATPGSGVVGGPGACWSSYEYDQVGNRVAETQWQPGGSATEHAYRYGQDGPHSLAEVTGDTPGTFSYDAAGHTTSINRDGQVNTLSWNSTSWNSTGRLDRIDTEAGTTRFYDDPAGTRILREDPNGDLTAWVAGYEITHHAATGTTRAGKGGGGGRAGKGGSNGRAGKGDGTARSGSGRDGGKGTGTGHGGGGGRSGPHQNIQQQILEALNMTAAHLEDYMQAQLDTMQFLWNGACTVSLYCPDYVRDHPPGAYGLCLNVSGSVGLHGGGSGCVWYTEDDGIVFSAGHEWGGGTPGVDATISEHLTSAASADEIAGGATFGGLSAGEIVVAGLNGSYSDSGEWTVGGEVGVGLSPYPIGGRFGESDTSAVPEDEVRWDLWDEMWDMLGSNPLVPQDDPWWW